MKTTPNTPPARRLLLLSFIMLLLTAVPVTPEVTGKSVFIAATSPTKTGLILVGDSRAIAMYRAIGSEAAESGWSLRSGQGYDWMAATGLPQVERIMQKGDCVAICMGCNSLYGKEASKYVALLNKKAREWAVKGVRMYYVTINPVEDAKKIALGSKKRDAQVVAFNEELKAKLDPNLVGYIDTYSKIVGNFTTVDGTHYPDELNARIYHMILDAVREDNRRPHVSVIFNRNRTAADSCTATARCYEGANLMFPPTWTKPGYRFAGWACSSSGTPEIAPGATVTAAWIREHWAGVELYAVWKPARARLCFYRNYAKTDSRRRTVTYAAGEMTSGSFGKRPGWVQLGWATERGSKKAEFPMDFAVTDAFIDEHSGTTALYAVWEPRTAMFRFYRNASRSDKTHKSRRFKAGRKAVMRPPAWSKKGYRLAGWSRKRGAAQAEVPAAFVVTNEMIEEYQDGVTWYAVWGVSGDGSS